MVKGRGAVSGKVALLFSSVLQSSAKSKKHIRLAWSPGSQKKRVFAT